MNARASILAALLAATAGADEPARFDGAKWIWFSQPADQSSASEDEGACYFRGAVTLSAAPALRAADVFITADNLYTLYVNGRAVGQSTADPNTWNRPRRFDVTAFLRPGRNVLAIEAVNTAPGAAALLVKLIARPTEGSELTFTTDGTWKINDREEKNWTQPEFNDQPWRSAFVLGDYGRPPWGAFAPDLAALAATPPLLSNQAPVDWSRQPSADGTAVTEQANPPADFAWPEAIAFIGDDCSLYRPPGGTGTAYDSLTVTIFNPRHSRAFPEHDLPAPMKVGHTLRVLQPARPGAVPRVLLDAGRGAIGSPSVTFDGRAVLVSMARAGDAFFHLYRVPLDGSAPVRLTDGPFHDIDPAELPDGRIVFTSTRAGTFEEYHNTPSRALFTMHADGTSIRPLTSTFIFDNEPEVLADGRILMLRSDNFFDRGKVETMLHAVHPDGTDGYTEFGLDNGPEYGGRLRAFNCGSPAPMPDGRVAFVNGNGITIARPGQAAPNWRNLRCGAGDVAALPDGRLLCTLARRTAVELPVAAGQPPRIVQDLRYGRLAVLDLDRPRPTLTVLYESTNTALHSPVWLGPRPRPPALVQKVAPERATAYFFCQDARFTKNTTAGWPLVRAIRVLSGKGLTMRSSHSYIVHAGSEVIELGTVPLAPDGSFHVEVPADTAVAFQAVDAEGRSELNEMSWIFARPGEQRACLGCHQPRQTAPPTGRASALALRAPPLRLTGGGAPHRFRGNNAAVTGLMELQFDRYREVAGLNRHSETADPAATGAQEVLALAEQLRTGDPAHRVTAAQRLAIFRDPAAATALAAQLRDTNREVRVAAAIALADCGTRDSVPPLLAALADKDPLAAQAAAMALENLTGHAEAFNAFAETSVRTPQAAQWAAWFQTNSWDAIERDLASRLDAADRDEVRRAAVALGHTGSDAARAALRTYVTRERENNPLPEWRKHHQGDGAQFNSLAAVNPRTLQAATRALGWLKDAAAVPLLGETLNRFAVPTTGNLFLAEAAAEALGRIGTPEAETALVDAFARLADYPRHTSWYGDHGALMACHAAPVHSFIIEALDALGSTSATGLVTHMIRSVPTDTDRALFAGIDDYETLVGRVIRRQGAEAAVVESCLSLLGDEAAARTKEIADALGSVHGAWGGHPDAENRAAQILSLVCRDRRYEPRVRAAFDRHRAKPVDIPRVFDRGIPVVQKLPGRHWVAFFLARTLGHLGDPASADALIAALDQSPTESAIGRPDPLGPGVLFLHNDLTPCWRAATAWALGRVGDRRAAPVLLKTIADLDNAPDTRHACAEALQQLADPASRDAIRKLAADYPETSTRKALERAGQLVSTGAL